MVVLNYTGGEVNAKIVYYGPGLSGKTTNLEFIHDRTPEGSRGKMVSMKTQTDRTLFFDFLPLELGDISGYRTRFLLYTVPGQVYYNATRKLVLKGVDAVVFVADSSRGKLEENLESLRNLEQNLNEHGMTLDDIPWVIQYNKRDAADAMAVADLDARLNPLRVPSFEAVATLGKGVYETFHGIATLVYRVLKERLERELEAAPAASAPPAAAAPAPARAARAAGGPQPRPAGQAPEAEFDIDSMLREMDAPAGRTARPLAAASGVKKTVNMEGPAPAAAGAPSPDASAPPAGEPRSLEDSGEFEHGPEFDHELGRVPALDDAALASDHARNEGPNEFVTDPMRRAAAAPRPQPRPQPKPAPLANPAPVAIDIEVPPALIEVPVVLTTAQVRAGTPVRVVLHVHIEDE